MISWARNTISTACRKAVTSNWSSAFRNFSKFRLRVPIVNCRVILHAGVGALPGGLGDLTHQVAGAQRLHGAAVEHGLEVEVGVGLVGPHELVGDPDRV